MTARETEDGALLPCPFCGSVDVKPRNDDVAYLPPATRYVLCRGCGASGANVETEAEAIAAWNRRAPLPSNWRTDMENAPRDPASDEQAALLNERFVELKRAQSIIDGLKAYREDLLTLPAKLEPAGRRRIKELSSPPTDDHDRTVLLLIDDYERLIRAVANSPKVPAQAPEPRGTLSQRDAPSDEVVEAVARAHYEKTTAMVAVLRPGGEFMQWEELPVEQRRVTTTGARAAIEAYQKATEGEPRGEVDPTIEAVVEALRAAKRLCDNINEFGACTDFEIYDAADTAIRAALDAYQKATGGESPECICPTCGIRHGGTRPGGEPGF